MATAASGDTISEREWWREGWSLTLNAGWSSVGNSSDIFVGDIEFEDAGTIGAALNKRLVTVWEHLALESEAQVNQHFGDNDHTELNALLLARWTLFPWNDFVRTTAAIGDGLSYATETPKLERADHGNNTSKLLNYVVGEITLAPPSSELLSLSLRYQHRSGVGGLFNGVREGSTVFALGVKYAF